MKHLDENTIQAFIDGELSGKKLNFATTHLTVCRICTNAVSQAEAEISQFETIFTTDAGCGVPTQRIWARIENEIEFLDRNPIQEPANGVWQKVSAHIPSFSKSEFFNFSSQQFIFGGSLAAVILVSLFAVGFLREQQNNVAADSIAAVDVPLTNTQNAQVTPKIPVKDDFEIIGTTNFRLATVKQTNLRVDKPSKVEPQPTFQRASFVESPKSKVQSPKFNNRNLTVNNANNLKGENVLPEERQYIKAIADLTKTDGASDESQMRPSFQVQYKNSLATINQAITTMQKQVRKNPKDENARQILFASYQNKIDLLNTISENSQLMASLK
ncbi:MAG: hypothetical protein H7Z37_03430 [Pyrinomonadaceae bacterium]|nr:hypothetical protein [Pyrinomonadaceae bacterium]